MKTRRTLLAASVALASLVPVLTPAPAAAFIDFGGAAASLKEIAELIRIQEKQDDTTGAVEDVGNEVRDVGDSLTEELRRGLGTVVGNIRESLQGEARMKQLEDERSRQRAIETEKMAALKEVDPIISNQDSCEIVTRWYKTGTLKNRPDLILSEGTLASLEQMAALSMGGPIGDSGEPVKTVSLQDKKQREVLYQAAQYCDGPQAAAGICQAPAPEELQGANYVAAKSILKSNQYSTPEEAQSCTDFVLNMSPETEDDLARIGPAVNPNGYDKIGDRFSYEARRSLAATLAQGYCEARMLTSVTDDPTLQSSIDLARKTAGFSQESYKNANGEEAMSQRMRLQFEARRWETRHAEDGLTEGDRQANIAKNLGFMTTQLDYIQTALEQNTLLLANQNSMTGEMLQLQKNAAQP